MLGYAEFMHGYSLDDAPTMLTFCVRMERFRDGH
jgi:hypothetical protein